jgi:hypothetical protein
MYLLLAGMSLEEGDHERAAGFLGRAGDAVIPEKCLELVVISLVSCLLSVHKCPYQHSSEDVWVEF